jgi:hypothetical protein
LKETIHRGNHCLRDQDAVIQFLASQHGKSKSKSNESDHPSSIIASDKENCRRNSRSHKLPFSFVVTRPTIMIKDGPSRKKLAASKSQPGVFSMTNTDLADFTLNALLNKKLYNSCPYVVADGK